MAGRPNLAAEDIWGVARMALRHRLVLGYEALADGIKPDQIVEDVLGAHPSSRNRLVPDAALTAELRGRLERLSLRSRRRVTAQWSGRHSSRHKGESLDFADYREYVPGDDFRRIDHNLWARLGVLLVRQFEAEEELPLKVVIDTSASMGFYRKLEVGKVLAGMMAYLGLAGGDRVQVYRVRRMASRCG